MRASRRIPKTNNLPSHLTETEHVLRLAFLGVIPTLFGVEAPVGRLENETFYVQNQEALQRSAQEAGVALEAHIRASWVSLLEMLAPAALPRPQAISVRIVEDVLQMLGSRREVVILRGHGMSWKSIQVELPERAFFSMEDDYARALQHLWAMHAPALKELRELGK